MMAAMKWPQLSKILSELIANPRGEGTNLISLAVWKICSSWMARLASSAGGGSVQTFRSLIFKIFSAIYCNVVLAYVAGRSGDENKHCDYD